eukprot:732040-Rhodomonas_salina.1
MIAPDPRRLANDKRTCTSTCHGRDKKGHIRPTQHVIDNVGLRNIVGSVDRKRARYVRRLRHIKPSSMVQNSDAGNLVLSTQITSASKTAAAARCSRSTNSGSFTNSHNGKTTN